MRKIKAILALWLALRARSYERATGKTVEELIGCDVDGFLVRMTRHTTDEIIDARDEVKSDKPLNKIKVLKPC